MNEKEIQNNKICGVQLNKYGQGHLQHQKLT